MAFPSLRALARLARDRRRRSGRERLAARLLAAGLVDAEFVRAQLGEGIPLDARAAAAAWATTEPRLGYAPHPLVEPAWSARRGTLGPLLAEPATAAGIRRAGELVRALGPRAVVPGSDVPWGELRAKALQRAASFRLQDERSQRRPVPAWTPDEAAPLADSGDLVTVVMPVCDREAVVGAAIASVVAQRYRHWELIVVDDGSTDGTAAVVDDWAARDARVSRLSQEPAGVSAARNRGIGAGTGRWIAFLDSDNQWTPDHLAAAVAAIDESTAVHTAVRVRAAAGIGFLAEPTDRASLLDGRNAIDMNALVAPRRAVERVGGFAEELRRWVDYDLVLRLSETLRFRFVPVLGVEYDHRDEVTDRITTRESPRWRRVVLARALVDRAELAARATTAASGVTAVIRNRNQWPSTLETLEALLAVDEVVEVVVIDAASYRAESAILEARTLGDNRVEVMRSAVDWGRSLSLLVASARARASVVALVEPGSRPDASRVRAAVADAEQGIRLLPGARDGVIAVAPVAALAAPDALDFIEDPLEPSEPAAR